MKSNVKMYLKVCENQSLFGFEFNRHFFNYKSNFIKLIIHKKTGMS